LSSVRSFLGAKDWSAALPFVAGMPRVGGTMEWYYARHQWQPFDGEIEIAAMQRMNAGGREMLRVQASTAKRAAIWLLLVREGDQWKIDWELFADAAVVRWQSFVSEPPDTVVELPLLVERKPAPEAYVVKAGGTPELHDAIIFRARDRQSAAVAVVAKESVLWKDLAGIDFENPVSVIARVAMVAPQFDPPLVRLESIVQKGWLRAPQLPAPEDSPMR